MPRPKRTLALLLLPILLSACARPPAPTAAIDASVSGSDAAARRAYILKQLRPLCGSQRQWTKAQRAQVADFIERTANDPVQQLEAQELDRLSRQVDVCRNAGVPALQ
jgi:type IV pilus biogenesis protein CpaD/CtpE